MNARMACRLAVALDVTFDASHLLVIMPLIVDVLLSKRGKASRVFRIAAGFFVATHLRRNTALRCLTSAAASRRRTAAPFTLWLPDKQVEAMADLNTPVGATLAESLGIVSIEIVSPEERPESNVK
jgi:hypothetical protein